MLQVRSLVEALEIVSLHFAHVTSVLAHELETFVRHRNDEGRDHNPQHRLPMVRDEDN